MDHTSLFEAVTKLDRPLVNLLISQGENVDPEVDDGYTCLHLLCELDSNPSESREIAKLLLDAGANIERRGVNNYTPLHMAAARGRLDLVELFVEHGADVNARTEIDGNETPLMEAIYGIPTETAIKVIQVLLNAGADPMLTNIFGETAMDLIIKKYGEDARWLFSSLPRPDSSGMNK